MAQDLLDRKERDAGLLHEARDYDLKGGSSGMVTCGGRQSLSRCRPGSDTEKVVRAGKAPLLIVRSCPAAAWSRTAGPRSGPSARIP